MLFEEFLPLFYAHAPLAFLESSTPSDLCSIAQQILAFIQPRSSAAKRLVRVFNPEEKIHGWRSERTVVELNTDDSPFILDSVTAEISQQGYRIYEIVHPVLRVARTSEGNIALVSAMRDAENKGKPESIMHLEISHIADAGARKKLEQDIGHVLELVRFAVDDWRQVLEKAKGVLRYLEKSILPFDALYIEEVRAFLTWLLNNNFTFLGYREYVFREAKGRLTLEPIEDTELGIFRSRIEGFRPQGLQGLPRKALEALRQPSLLEITKSTRKSRVHRPAHMDYIGIKKFDAAGKVVGEFRLLGLFTSTVYFQSATLIPIIRDKIDAIVKRAGFLPDSHNGKALLSILENYPRDELFQISEQDLFTICMGILEMLERPQPRLFVRHDRFGRFVSGIVFIPRERFSTSIRLQVQQVLEQAYRGRMSDYYVQLGETLLARVHYIIATDAEHPVEGVQVADIEKKLLDITSSWVDGLRQTLIKQRGEREGETLFQRYVEAFPEAYKDQYSAMQTCYDIYKLEQAGEKEDIAVELYRRGSDERFSYHLKIYHHEQVTLSDILPTLENMGFQAVDEFTYYVTPKGREKGMWLLHFRLRVRDGGSGNEQALKTIKPQFEEALVKIWHKEIGSDALNQLILLAELPWRDVAILRTYSKYIQQTAFPYSHEFMCEALSSHPKLARILVELFYLRFEKPYVKARIGKAEMLLKAMDEALSSVSNVSEDRVIRQFRDTITATLRTNFFQKNLDGKDKPYISIKLDSAKVPNLPLPLPFVEIFVYSHQVEGIHLRGGKVARGGLRWSDRKADFRTEVLGLMKAQMVKNSVIVPVGSKGGFVVKYPVQGNREEALAQGIECYKTFLRGLLDLTDNIVKSKVVPPCDVVRHDEDDPYLVVAADKGTATFSDIANGISAEYGFWLGDAFASGGSAGYDHKKMAITARGGWVSVHRHFQEIGLDTQKDDFTAVGIGDMSGDVFGNGMLQSKHIRLVAAFNHQHIFIDPNPDAAASFKERQRLFNLPRSSWSDYDSKLISAGGGIFERKAKSIHLSRQIKELLDINRNDITPEELIRKILSARVDLLWNGGIGTYVKASSESNESVGDKTNDTVRINGAELRCKVVGEGGNLGFTQLGRIEYALKGGRLNTDAIDNSGGVDCSDHEVNMKIALRHAIDTGKLTLKKRDTLLAEMTDEVASLVLRNNFLQTQRLTIAELQGGSLVEPLNIFMQSLEREGSLKRKVEFLPDEEAIKTRRGMGRGLTRPELSVLLAYAKIHLFNELMRSELPDDPYFEEDLLRYFPEPMRRRFATEIKEHELRRELVATIVANSIVNRVGITFFHQLSDESGMDGCNIARSYTATRDAFGLRGLWLEIEALSGIIPVRTQVELFLEVEHLIERGTLWFLRNMPQPLDVAKAVEELHPGIGALTACLDRILSRPVKEDRDRRLEGYVGQNVPRTLAKKIANLDALASACDIVQVTRGGKFSLDTVGQIYFDLGMRLNLGWLRISARKLLSDSYWNRLSIRTLVLVLFEQQRRLTAAVLADCKDNRCAGTLDAWCKANRNDLERYDQFIQELKKQESIDLSMLTVAIRRVEAIHASR